MNASPKVSSFITLTAALTALGAAAAISGVQAQTGPVPVTVRFQDGSPPVVVPGRAATEVTFELIARDEGASLSGDEQVRVSFLDSNADGGELRFDPPSFILSGGRLTGSGLTRIVRISAGPSARGPLNGAGQRDAVALRLEIESRDQSVSEVTLQLHLLPRFRLSFDPPGVFEERAILTVSLGLLDDTSLPVQGESVAVDGLAWMPARPAYLTETVNLAGTTLSPGQTTVSVGFSPQGVSEDQIPSLTGFLITPTGGAVSHPVYAPGLTPADTTESEPLSLYPRKISEERYLVGFFGLPLPFDFDLRHLTPHLFRKYLPGNPSYEWELGRNLDIPLVVAPPVRAEDAVVIDGMNSDVSGDGVARPNQDYVDVIPREHEFTPTVSINTSYRPVAPASASVERSSNRYFFYEIAPGELDIDDTSVTDISNFLITDPSSARITIRAPGILLTSDDEDLVNHGELRLEPNSIRNVRLRASDVKPLQGTEEGVFEVTAEMGDGSSLTVTPPRFTLTASQPAAVLTITGATWEGWGTLRVAPVKTFSRPEADPPVRLLNDEPAAFRLHVSSVSPVLTIGDDSLNTEVEEGATAMVTVEMSRPLPEALTVGYGIRPDGNSFTDDAEEADYTSGDVITIEAGRTFATIEIHVNDDDDAEPTREAFEVFLTASENGLYRLIPDRSSAIVVIHEGVCDRTGAVRDAIVGAVSGVSSCADVDDAALAGITGSFDVEVEVGDDGNVANPKAGDFSGLVNLRVLAMSSPTRAISLSANMFDGLDGLAELYLPDNGITALPDGVFSGLGSVHALDLINNELTALGAAQFSDLTSLTSLLLGSNRQLSMLAPDAFSGLNRLRTLALGDTALTSLPANLFSGLTLSLLTLPDAAVMPLQFEVVDDSDVPNSARLKVVLAPGTPFDLPVGLSTVNVTSSTTSVLILAGDTESDTFEVQREDPGAEAVVSFTAAPMVPAGSEVTFDVSDTFVMMVGTVPSREIAVLFEPSEIRLVRGGVAADATSGTVILKTEPELQGAEEVVVTLSATGGLEVTPTGPVRLSPANGTAEVTVEADADSNSGKVFATLDADESSLGNAVVTTQSLTVEVVRRVGLALSGHENPGVATIIAGGSTDVTVTTVPPLEAGEQVTVTLSVAPDLTIEGASSALIDGNKLVLTGESRSATVRISTLAPDLDLTEGVSSSGVGVNVEVIADASLRIVSEPAGGAAEVSFDVAGDLIEAEEGGTVNLIVTVSQSPAVDLTVNYRIGNDGNPGTADADADDYTDSGGGSVTVKANATMATIPITITDDNAIEPTSESFTVSLEDSGLSYSVSPASPEVLVVIKEGICDRLPVVQTKLLAAIPDVSVCSAVTASHLKNVTMKLEFIWFDDGSPLLGLRAGDFSGLTGLTELRILDNRLPEFLPENLFLDLSALQKLFISNVNTSLRASPINFPPGIFQGLDALEELTIREIHEKTIEQAPKISTLPATIFHGLGDTLRMLRLDENNLGTRLPQGIFSGLSSTLTELSLQKNELTELPAGIFEGLSGLGREDARLWLHDNPRDNPRNLVFTVELKLLSIPAAGEYRLVAELAQGAPFTMTIPVTVTGADSSSPHPSAVTISAGSTRSESFGVRRQDGETLEVALGEPPDYAPPAVPADTLPDLAPLMRYRGFEIALSEERFTPAAEVSFDVAGDLIEAEEGSTVNLIITVSRAPPVDLTVNYRIGNDGNPDTADADGSDYSDPGGGSVTIEANAAMVTIPITITDDNAIEPTSESFTVSLTLDPGYEVISPSRVLVVIREGICDRLPVVRTKLLAAIPDVNICSAVTTSHLNHITARLMFNIIDDGGMSLQGLRDGDFSGLTGLTELLISTNILPEFPPENIFSDLGALRKLFLERINIFPAVSSINFPPGIFQGLDALEELWIRDYTEQAANIPKISTLPVTIFQGLGDTLRKLQFDENNFGTRLPQGIFAGLSNLQLLDLNSNKLQSLSPAFFSGLSSTLTELILDKNELTELPAGIFEGLSGLGREDGRLWLHDNPEANPRNLVFTVELKLLSISAAGEYRLVAELAQGAPFTMTIPITATGADSSSPHPSAVTISAGSTRSESFDVRRQDGETLEVALGEPPNYAPPVVPTDTLPGSSLMRYRGFEIALSGERFTPQAVSFDVAGDLIEAEEGSTVNLIVTVSRAPAVDLTVNYRIGNDGNPDTADADGSDYSDPGGGSVTIEANATMATIPVTITDDNAIEPTSESFTVSLTLDPGYEVISPSRVLVVIKEGICDRLPVVQTNLLAAIADVSVCSAVTASHLKNITMELAFNAVHDGLMMLRELRDGDFSGLTGLTELVIDDNGLPEFPPEDVFSELSALQTLNLSRLRFSSDINFPPGIFRGLDALEDMRITENTIRQGTQNFPIISTLPATIFQGLGDTLRELRLDVNNFGTRLPQGIFSGLGNLRLLDLNNNKLQSLSPAFFSGLSSTLTELFLQENELTELPAGIFEGLSGLGREDARLWLHDNPRDNPRNLVFTVELRLLSIPAAGEYRLVAELAQGAPFTMTIPVTATGASPSSPHPSAVTISAGSTRSESFDVRRQDGEALEVALGEPPDYVPPVVPTGTLPGSSLMRYRGFEIALSEERFTPQVVSFDVAGDLIEAEEGSTVNLIVTVSRAPPVDLTVNYRIGDDGNPDTADADDSDYSDPGGGSVTIEANATMATIPITITDDNVIEPTSESFTVSLTLDPGYEVVSSSRVLVVIREGICDRLPIVQTKLLAAIPDVNICSAVTTSHLNNITARLVFNLIDDGGMSLQGLRNGDFSGLTGLTELVIATNVLPEFPPENVFSDLGALRKLRLTTVNTLPNFPSINFPPGIFQGLDALEELTISEIHETAIEETPKISTLPATIFQGLGDTLRKLWLDENNFGTRLSQGIFAGLDNLQLLDLSENRLQSLSPAFFSGLSSTLTDLILDENELTELSAGIFDGLSGLGREDARLWLHGNPEANPRNLVFTVELKLLSIPAAGEYRLVAELAQGAPFTMTIPITATGASPSSPHPSAVTISAGSIRSESFDVRRQDEETLEVALGEPPDYAPPVVPTDTWSGSSLMRYSGFEIALSGERFTPAEVTSGPLMVPVEEGGTAMVVVEVDRTMPVALTINYEIGTDGDPDTADADDSDYSDSGGGSVTIEVNATMATIPITITDDNDVEPTSESFTVRLAAGGYALGTSSMTLVVIKEGVCDRTPQIRDQIVADVSGVTRCADVTDANLRGLSSFAISPSRRQVTTLKPGDFQGFSHLETLNLSNNDLTTLPSSVFSDLDDLVSLDLRSNSLTTLPSSVFSGLGKLLTLRLDSNDLTVLPPELFLGLSRLGTLDMAGNPGAPFTWIPRFSTAVGTEPPAPGAARFNLTLDRVAPFTVAVALSVEGGSVTNEVRIPQGSTESASFIVEQSARFSTVRMTPRWVGSVSSGGIAIHKDEPLVLERRLRVSVSLASRDGVPLGAELVLSQRAGTVVRVSIAEGELTTSQQVVLRLETEVLDGEPLDASLPTVIPSSLTLSPTLSPTLSLEGLSTEVTIESGDFGGSGGLFILRVVADDGVELRAPVELNVRVKRRIELSFSPASLTLVRGGDSAEVTFEVNPVLQGSEEVALALAADGYTFVPSSSAFNSAQSSRRITVSAGATATDSALASSTTVRAEEASSLSGFASVEEIDLIYGDLSLLALRGVNLVLEAQGSTALIADSSVEVKVSTDPLLTGAERTTVILSLADGLEATGSGVSMDDDGDARIELSAGVPTQTVTVSVDEGSSSGEALELVASGRGEGVGVLEGASLTLRVVKPRVSVSLTPEAPDQVKLLAPSGGMTTATLSINLGMLENMREAVLNVEVEPPEGLTLISPSPTMLTASSASTEVVLRALTPGVSGTLRVSAAASSDVEFNAVELPVQVLQRVVVRFMDASVPRIVAGAAPSAVTIELMSSPSGVELTGYEEVAVSLSGSDAVGPGEAQENMTFAPRHFTLTPASTRQEVVIGAAPRTRGPVRGGSRQLTTLTADLEVLSAPRRASLEMGLVPEFGLGFSETTLTLVPGNESLHSASVAFGVMGPSLPFDGERIVGSVVAPPGVSVAREGAAFSSFTFEVSTTSAELTMSVSEDAPIGVFMVAIPDPQVESDYSYDAFAHLGPEYGVSVSAVPLALDILDAARYQAVLTPVAPIEVEQGRSATFLVATEPRLNAGESATLRLTLPDASGVTFGDGSDLKVTLSGMMLSSVVKVSASATAPIGSLIFGDVSLDVSPLDANASVSPDQPAFSVSVSSPRVSVNLASHDDMTLDAELVLSQRVGTVVRVSIAEGELMAPQQAVLRLETEVLDGEPLDASLPTVIPSSLTLSPALSPTLSLGGLSTEVTIESGDFGGSGGLFVLRVVADDGVELRAPVELNVRVKRRIELSFSPASLTLVRGGDSTEVTFEVNPVLQGSEEIALVLAADGYTFVPSSFVFSSAQSSRRITVNAGAMATDSATVRAEEAVSLSGFASVGEIDLIYGDLSLSALRGVNLVLEPQGSTGLFASSSVEVKVSTDPLLVGAERTTVILSLADGLEVSGSGVRIDDDGDARIELSADVTTQTVTVTVVERRSQGEMLELVASGQGEGVGVLEGAFLTLRVVKPRVSVSLTPEAPNQVKLLAPSGGTTTATLSIDSGTLENMREAVLNVEVEPSGGLMLISPSPTTLTASSASTEVVLRALTPGVSGTLRVSAAASSDVEFDPVELPVQVLQRVVVRFMDASVPRIVAGAAPSTVTIELVSSPSRVELTGYEEVAVSLSGSDAVGPGETQENMTFAPRHFTLTSASTRQEVVISAGPRTRGPVRGGSRRLTTLTADLEVLGSPRRASLEVGLVPEFGLGFSETTLTLVPGNESLHSASVAFGVMGPSLPFDDERIIGDVAAPPGVSVAREGAAFSSFTFEVSTTSTELTVSASEDAPIGVFMVAIPDPQVESDYSYDELAHLGPEYGVSVFASSLALEIIAAARYRATLTPVAPIEVEQGRSATFLVATEPRLNAGESATLTLTLPDASGLTFDMSLGMTPDMTPDMSLGGGFDLEVALSGTMPSSVVTVSASATAPIGSLIFGDVSLDVSPLDSNASVSPNQPAFSVSVSSPRVSMSLASRDGVPLGAELVLSQRAGTVVRVSIAEGELTAPQQAVLRLETEVLDGEPLDASLPTVIPSSLTLSPALSPTLSLGGLSTEVTIESGDFGGSGGLFVLRVVADGGVELREPVELNVRVKRRIELSFSPASLTLVRGGDSAEVTLEVNPVLQGSEEIALVLAADGYTFVPSSFVFSSAQSSRRITVNAGAMATDSATVRAEEAVSLSGFASVGEIDLIYGDLSLSALRGVNLVLEPQGSTGLFASSSVEVKVSTDPLLVGAERTTLILSLADGLEVSGSGVRIDDDGDARIELSADVTTQTVTVTVVERRSPGETLELVASGRGEDVGVLEGASLTLQVVKPRLWVGFEPSEIRLVRGGVAADATSETVILKTEPELQGAEELMVILSATGGLEVTPAGPVRLSSANGTAAVTVKADADSSSGEVFATLDTDALSFVNTVVTVQSLTVEVVRRVGLTLSGYENPGVAAIVAGGSTDVTVTTAPPLEVGEEVTVTLNVASDLTLEGASSALIDGNKLVLTGESRSATVRISTLEPDLDLTEGVSSSGVGMNVEVAAGVSLRIVSEPADEVAVVLSPLLVEVQQGGGTAFGVTTEPRLAVGQSATVRLTIDSNGAGLSFADDSFSTTVALAGGTGQSGAVGVAVEASPDATIGSTSQVTSETEGFAGVHVNIGGKSQATLSVVTPRVTVGFTPAGGGPGDGLTLNLGASKEVALSLTDFTLSGGQTAKFRVSVVGTGLTLQGGGTSLDLSLTATETTAEVTVLASGTAQPVGRLEVRAFGGVELSDETQVAVLPVEVLQPVALGFDPGVVLIERGRSTEFVMMMTPALGVDRAATVTLNVPETAGFRFAGNDVRHQAVLTPDKTMETVRISATAEINSTIAVSVGVEVTAGVDLDSLPSLELTAVTPRVSVTFNRSELVLAQGRPESVMIGLSDYPLEIPGQEVVLLVAAQSEAGDLRVNGATQVGISLSEALPATVVPVNAGTPGTGTLTATAVSGVELIEEAVLPVRILSGVSVKFEPVEVEAAQGGAVAFMVTLTSALTAGESATVTLTAPEGLSFSGSGSSSLKLTFDGEETTRHEVMVSVNAKVPPGVVEITSALEPVGFASAEMQPSLLVRVLEAQGAKLRIRVFLEGALE